MKIAMKLLAAAGAAALVIVASPAMAHAPYTVTAGSQTTGTVAFDGTTTADGIKFYTDFVTMGCESGSATGNVNLGTVDGDGDGTPDGNGVANITDTGWNNCIGPLGIAMTVDQIGTWDLNVQGNNVGGVIAGTITNVNARVASVTPGQCEFTVTGQVGGSFDDEYFDPNIDPPKKQQLLTVDDTSPDNNLVVSDVTGCFGQVVTGDQAYFAATYDITNSSDGDLAIASS